MTNGKNSNGNGHALAVHVRSVTKTFGKGDAATHALKGVDFDARLGEMLLIVGPSGCGKTTLLSVIAGTLEFDGGEIDVFNSPLHELRPRDVTEYRKRNVGFIFQQFNLISTLNLIENVSVPLIINGSSRRAAEKKAVALLDELGLEGRGKDTPLNLSGGQQQRVAIARALVHEPKLLVCDEPTAALDAASGRTVMGLIREVAVQADRAVIVVTHDSRVYDFGDRIVSMNDGGIEKIETDRARFQH